MIDAVRRLTLVALMLQDRPIVLLDEPFSDPRPIALRHLQPRLDQHRYMLVTHPRSTAGAMASLSLSRPA
ncbi:MULTISPECIES: hypothetical protein [unclassified Thioalkalivibrio]|uniref:hypothetical protein n=1 Tax=unclassified Thioalkalivibrio TaxID=2621013 RepID=UPI001E471580|nr:MULTISPECIES: hypothetical protein [unclassified Thioalkalivibrio]